MFVGSLLHMEQTGVYEDTLEPVPREMNWGEEVILTLGTKIMDWGVQGRQKDTSDPSLRKQKGQCFFAFMKAGP